MAAAKARLLVAESDAVLRMLIVSTLEDDGYEVLQANRGDMALELLDVPDNIDLMITSIRLDGINGLDLARRACTHGESVPAVFASGDHARLRSAIAPGGTRRLHKPYTMAQLQAAVASLLAGSSDAEAEDTVTRSDQE